MAKTKSGKTMLTDFYQLTMNAGYLDSNKNKDMATFDLFIRNLPKDWGYYIANGIEDAIDYITNIHFSKEDIRYLRSLGRFNENYLKTLSAFRFEGEIYAPKEGTPVFPNEPIFRVTSKREQAQFVETTLLNMINFQTMIASKASRIVTAAFPAEVYDFGLRRAQEEDAAMKGTRACYLAGAVATSNVKAGKEYGIKVGGTMAHSFVMAFDDELDAFRAYAKTFPTYPVLLIDTYDTINGAKNAIIIAKELEASGKKLGAVRLDSGDLEKLSKRVRSILDDANLGYVNVVASNDLNEYKIESLVKNNAPISSYGVGTEMLTAKPVAAIPGVYKLVEDESGARIKLSEGKKTLPGKKQVYRQYGPDGLYLNDIITLDEEKIEGRPILEQVVKNGERTRERPSLDESRKYCISEISRLPDYLKKTSVIGQYPVNISKGLSILVDSLTRKYERR
jgi:nicotinate phosphoribosyltransferase